VRRCLQGRELHDAAGRVLAQHLDGRTQRAWIIGSESRKQALPGADIDIALEGPTPMPLEAIARIRDDLERLPTLRTFDLVDLRRTTDRFREEALTTAIPLVPRAEDGDRVEG
jgi:predicted nucleotidyltransferase